MASKLTPEQIQLSNERIYSINAVKVKYMILGFYNNYMNIKTLGFVKLMGFSDGLEIVTNFLTATFDSEEVGREVLEELRAKDMSRILEITKKINELVDEPEVKNETPPPIQE
ncbi:hypothetical protein [Clostridium sp.]|uniref:hypothetical protein n=1 Tax=Clostridium sp. TaxID=1506 RepID=UPI001A3DB194|nr:hypothetical protein [Clostridium sp.]MBK5239822.1 hypothetical protein [Clostridium sp.]